MTKDKQINEVIYLISEMIIKYITDNKQDKKKCNDRRKTSCISFYGKYRSIEMAITTIFSVIKVEVKYIL